MMTMRRLYLYGVLGVTLVPLLLGLSELVRLTLTGFTGGRPVAEAAVREDLSWALALVLVAVPVWAAHLWLLRRSARGSAETDAEERASVVRAVYFFVVLVGTGAVASLDLFDLLSQLAAVVMTGSRAWDLAAALAGVIVVGSAWFLHVLWRRSDLRAVPERLTGDWSTRAYLYGALTVLAVMAAFWLGGLLALTARELLEVLGGSGASAWWQHDIVDPLAGTIAASSAWCLHWMMSERLTRAPSPLGEAQRESRARPAYFLTVVLLCAAVVLVTVSEGLGHVLAEMAGVWRPSEGSRLVEDIGGALVMAVPFLLLWWWHLRRAATEALRWVGVDRHREVLRSGRLVVAFVGLAGLAVGAAWLPNALLDYSDATADFVRSATMRDAVLPALALTLVGLVMWAPAWVSTQRHRARGTLDDASSTVRRAYLLLVSGLSVVALIPALAFLVYQAVRVVLDAGGVDEPTWVAGVLPVAIAVLAYHLTCLRADVLVARSAEAPAPGPAAEQVVETIEISAPSGADFKVLNAAIRTELPDGFSMRVIEGRARQST